MGGGGRSSAASPESERIEQRDQAGTSCHAEQGKGGLGLSSQLTIGPIPFLRPDHLLETALR